MKLVRRTMKDLAPGEVVEVITDVTEQVFTLRASEQALGPEVDRPAGSAFFPRPAQRGEVTLSF